MPATNRSRSDSVTLLPTFFGVSLTLLTCAVLIIMGLVGGPAHGLSILSLGARCERRGY